MPRSVGRMELFAKLGRIMVAETMVAEAAAYVSEQEWRGRGRDATSFYVSQFPGGPRPCPRKLTYDLMNFPAPEPMPPMVGATAIVGKAVEEHEVSMLDAAGRLLSTPADCEDQVRIWDADNWISGRMDIVTLPPFWNRPLLTEKKTKDSDVVDDMRAMTRSYDPSHAYQTRAYIALLRELSEILWDRAVVCKHTWRIALPGSEPVIDAMVCRDHGIQDDAGCLIEIKLHPLQSGVLSYSSRNRPNVRASWYFEHDEQWWQNGLKSLRTAQEAYASNTIPPHPFGGKQWSAEPCKYCPHKRETCKPDHLAGVTKLSESHGVEWAQKIFGNYDPDAMRAKVLERWQGLTGLGYDLPSGYTIGRLGVQKEREHAAHA
jgi:hypothetical protein